MGGVGARSEGEEEEEGECVWRWGICLLSVCYALQSSLHKHIYITNHFCSSTEYKFAGKIKNIIFKWVVIKYFNEQLQNCNERT